MRALSYNIKVIFVVMIESIRFFFTLIATLFAFCLIPFILLNIAVTSIFSPVPFVEKQKSSKKKTILKLCLYGKNTENSYAMLKEYKNSPNLKSFIKDLIKDFPKYDYTNIESLQSDKIYSLFKNYPILLFFIGIFSTALFIASLAFLIALLIMSMFNSL